MGLFTAAGLLLLLYQIVNINCDRVDLGYKLESNWEYSGNGTGSWNYDTPPNELPRYGTCVSSGTKYLMTNFFDVKKANWVEVHITIVMQDCTKFLPTCKLFTTLYYTFPTPFDTPGNFDASQFVQSKKLGNLTDLPLSSSINKHATFNHTVLVDMNGNELIAFAFEDSGFCGSILKFSMSYAACPKQSGAYVEFDATPAPSKTVGRTTLYGKCVSNAYQTSVEALSMECFSNGSATFKGHCGCNIEYENTTIGCQKCSDGFFKDVAGNLPCLQCGEFSDNSHDQDRTGCKCNEGYHRRIIYLNDYDIGCELPPSMPHNISVANITSTSAVLSWDAPMFQGTGDDVRYTITCLTCSTRELKSNYMYRNITLELGSLFLYNISISSTNNVTKAVGVENMDYVAFNTSAGAPGMVRSVVVKLNSDGLGVITWQKPIFVGDSSLAYRVTYNSETLQTKETQATIKRPSKTTTFQITVQAFTKYGNGPPSPPESLKIFGASGVSAEVTVGISIALTVLLIIVVIVAIIFYKRRHPKHLQSIRYENGEVKLPNRSSGAKIYIDPTTYQDLTEAVTELAKELERSWIVLEKIIGGGEFGDVYKGTLERPGSDVYPIAVKTLKHGATRQARDDFLGEAAIMGQFDDPNVIYLEGVVLKEKPIMIVTEYMSNGSLDTFLKKNDNKFSSLQLLGMARGVTSGMMYLAELSFIHRDLAARNILVDENLVCKVADFGMSRELKMEDDTYDTKGGKIPVRWTAPEAIQFKKFTTASDVWSFGILLWEIMSYGEKPYWDWGNYEVLERVSNGYRLPPPMACPKMVHDLMLSSWSKDRVKRPKFRDIRDRIDKWIRNPDLLREEASVITRRDDNLDYTSMKTINEWLGAFKMSQYTTCFTSHGYSTPRQIFSLTDEDLKMLGVSALGHRNKIMNKINTTKGQLANDAPSRGKSIRI